MVPGWVDMMDWQRLAGTYGDRVYLVVRSILRDDALAMDVSQEALLKIGRALNGTPPVKDYEAWVLTVAGNAARDALRRKQRRREVAMEQDVVDDRSPDRALLQEESRERVTRALEALPAGARDILLLKFRQGLSGPEIASALGLSLSAAWQQMSRAMKLLRSKLTEPA
jgi:RNA polymerase sigma factor (sigma-70 family)